LSALTALPPDQRRRGVVAATRGNHGLGIAYAARLLGIPAAVCVPRGNNPEKNEAIRDLAAELVEKGDYYDDAIAAMERLARERGMRPVHSTEDRDVLAGAGTMTLEVLEQAEVMGESIGAMVFALGGGSQAVGAMTVLRHRGLATAVYAVGAENAPAQHDSWHAGRPLTSDRAGTMADGIATRTTYPLTFDALREGLAGFVQASEAEIAEAVRLMLRATHNLAEGAGAAGLAGLRKLAPGLAGKSVVVVLSGGNIDRETLRRVVAGEV
jgi:threonine dehydratase